VKGIHSSLPRGTVTFLFTDIEGSTDLVRRLGDRYGDLRAEHGRLFEEIVPGHGGHIIDTQGDAFFAVFERVADAVAASIAAQRALAGRDWPEGAELRVRMGLHTAEPHLHESGYVGVGVHRAARICAAAHGGQILLSNATAGIVEDQELADVQLHDLGEFALKDLSRPQRLVELRVEGLEREFGPPTTIDAARSRELYGRVQTLLATDIRGWGRMIRTIGDDAASPIAAEYRQIVKETAAAHGGKTLEAVGDFVLAAFESARDALACALAIRDALQTHDWPEGVQFGVATAVHTGRIAAEDHVGYSAWHLAELCNSADPWQILVSHSTEALLEGESLRGFELRDLGERELSTSASPRRVFELLASKT
jgi:class 3 adenylate cyclase